MSKAAGGMSHTFLAHLGKASRALAITCRPSYVLNFHIYIFSSETTEPNQATFGSGRLLSQFKMAFVTKNGNFLNCILQLLYKSKLAQILTTAT